jgi:hypothetical protein
MIYLMKLHSLAIFDRTDITIQQASSPSKRWIRFLVQSHPAERPWRLAAARMKSDLHRLCCQQIPAVSVRLSPQTPLMCLRSAESPPSRVLSPLAVTVAAPPRMLASSTSISSPAIPTIDFAILSRAAAAVSYQSLCHALASLLVEGAGLK